MSVSSRIGVVAIGRNEGERLVRCLQSLRRSGFPVVYVDSNSSDGSFDRARELGACPVQLDLNRPFTAARARNFGYATLIRANPDLEIVQFVDGDCEVDAEWMATALQFLDEHPEAAVACGRRRERFPDASPYNLMCDMEWDTPVGEAKACGGDAMVRVKAFTQVGGYRDSLIAGEEPELCIRLRQAGWKIFRLDAEMTLHDAAMTRFGQWWRRSVRAGFAFAEGAHLHGAPPERHWVRESRRAWIWGVALPTATLLLAVALGPRAFLLLLVYPAQVLRLALKRKGSPRERLIWASLIVIGKFAEAAGQVRFMLARIRNAPQKLIEYK